MKIGVKTFDNPNFLKYFEDKVDFFEIMALQKTDYSFLRNFSLPMVIHAEHQVYGTNPADISVKEFNLKSINFARKIADLVNAKKIIAHPGDLKNENCSEQNSVDFFNELNDERICIENLPLKSSYRKLCHWPEEVKSFITQTKTRFCFDINHFIKTPTRFNGDYSFIKKFIELNPAHYHIGGQRISDGKEHLCLADSELDLRKILSYYPKSAEITLETEPIIDKTERDIEMIRNVSIR